MTAHAYVGRFVRVSFGGPLGEETLYVEYNSPNEHGGPSKSFIVRLSSGTRTSIMLGEILREAEDEEIEAFMQRAVSWWMLL